MRGASDSLKPPAGEGSWGGLGEGSWVQTEGEGSWVGAGEGSWVRAGGLTIGRHPVQSTSCIWQRVGAVGSRRGAGAVGPLYSEPQRVGGAQPPGFQPLPTATLLPGRHLGLPPGARCYHLRTLPDQGVSSHSAFFPACSWACCQAPHHPLQVQPPSALVFNQSSSEGSGRTRQCPSVLSGHHPSSALTAPREEGHITRPILEMGKLRLLGVFVRARVGPWEAPESVGSRDGRLGSPHMRGRRPCCRGEWISTRGADLRPCVPVCGWRRWGWAKAARAPSAPLTAEPAVPAVTGRRRPVPALGTRGF